jgi:hypothetical protein
MFRLSPNGIRFEHSEMHHVKLNFDNRCKTLFCGSCEGIQRKRRYEKNSNSFHAKCKGNTMEVKAMQVLEIIWHFKSL